MIFLTATLSAPLTVAALRHATTTLLRPPILSCLRLPSQLELAHTLRLCSRWRIRSWLWLRLWLELFLELRLLLRLGRCSCMRVCHNLPLRWRERSRRSSERLVRPVSFKVLNEMMTGNALVCVDYLLRLRRSVLLILFIAALVCFLLWRCKQSSV